ncbi:hypothetical protein LK485_18875, partial [Erysipelatoclostridium ramosum]|nr:hypothetical protein [Thomasclavelia ramosa]
GQVWIEGNKVCFKSPTEAMKSGIGFVPEDRKNAGLFLQQDVRFNTTITILHQIFKLLRHDSKKEKDIVNKMIQDIQIKVTGQEQIV